ncbi:5-hydroxytryptamine receptor 1B-like [Osmerus eperlanus]|uniref:5-hydroxytryptamine receptor 1B-like n=1 Tax=Osmerus eperlanus TaxID=29151 RepID=UPI002E10DD28
MGTLGWIEAFIRLLMFFFGTVGNSCLWLCSLPGPQTPLRTNELLFLNLAACNLLNNCLVDLPDTMSDFAGDWFMGKAYCSIFLFFADLSETSSIFSTLFISVFWNQKLVGSLKRGGAPVRLDNLRLVTVLLAGSWIVSVAFSVPRWFFSRLEGENTSRKCVEYYHSKTAVLMYDSVFVALVNAVPIAGTVFASLQIVVTLLQHRTRVQGLSAESHNNTGNAPPNEETTRSTNNDQRSSGTSKNQEGPVSDLVRTHIAERNPGSSSQVRAAKSVLAVVTVFLVCWLTHLLVRITSSIHNSTLISDIASYTAASYPSIIPYIFLYGAKKLTSPKQLLQKLIKTVRLLVHCRGVA